MPNKNVSIWGLSGIEEQAAIREIQKEGWLEESDIQEQEIEEELARAHEYFSREQSI